MILLTEAQKRKITFDVASNLLEERPGPESSNNSTQETSNDSNDDKFKIDSEEKFKIENDDKFKLLSNQDEPYQTQKVQKTILFVKIKPWFFSSERN